MASSNPETVDLVNRSVLDEIPLVLGKLSLTEAQQNISRVDNYANTVFSDIDCFPTPTTSPDELVINKRGPRTVYIPSPDIDELKQDLMTEPDGYNLDNSSVILTSTARKRLLFDSSDTDSKSTVSISNLKKLCTSPTVELPEVQPASNTMTLQEKDACIPAHELKYLDMHISYLQHNIYEAISNNTSKTSPSSFYQASMHILAFKRFVIDHGRHLAKCNQWQSVIDYVFMAWKHVCCTPNWDNPTHNTARTQCFNALKKLSMMALDEMKDTINKQKHEHYTRELKLLFDNSHDGLVDS